MSKKDFDEYIKRIRGDKDKKEPVEIDWGKKKDEWLRYLGQLYEIIQGFLNDYSKSGDLNISFENKLINEELIGEYKAPRMIIQLNGNSVIFEPIGTNLIGANGRVDMKGTAGTVKFVLVNKDSVKPHIKFTIVISGEPEPKEQEPDPKGIVWGWKIATPPPGVNYLEINEESFFDSLMEVING